MRQIYQSSLTIPVRTPHNTNSVNQLLSGRLVWVVELCFSCFFHSITLLSHWCKLNTLKRTYLKYFNLASIEYQVNFEICLTHPTVPRLTCIQKFYQSLFRKEIVYFDTCQGGSKCIFASILICISINLILLCAESELCSALKISSSLLLVQGVEEKMITI